MKTGEKKSGGMHRQAWNHALQDAGDSNCGKHYETDEGKIKGILYLSFSFSGSPAP